jgi:hypothetical protein
MIEPVAFGFNEQTAENNYFQQKETMPEAIIQEQALREFNRMADALRSKGIRLIIVKDTQVPHTPDSIFPNNWISFHEGGQVVLYPMYAENRRAERRLDILEYLKEEGFIFNHVTDYTAYENESRFLEGTGSMILDRENRVAYAALSERTNKELFLQFCADFQLMPVCFSANQTVNGKRLAIYHTNVMMCVGDRYAVVCLDSIDDQTEQKRVIDSLLSNRKEIIEISEQQMHRFAGNMLQVENIEGEKFLVMSESASLSLTENQLRRLAAYNEIISVSLPTIEKQGGGSARCMMAEVFD